jgi:precorrin-2/cobalt-factor-2 C20-methyltransferase
MYGRLFGLGVGPGDPELMTLKALRLLRAAPVVAYAATLEGASFARGIVAEWLDPRQHEIAIRFPMQPGPPPASIYREAAARLAAILDRGDDVAYLCQGDPLFFGSFAGILECLAGDYAVEIVPGVSSPMACTAAAAMPLVQRDEVLSVIPATLPETALAHRLAMPDAAVIVKLGRHFLKLRRVLAALDRLEGAIYVERASLPSERVTPLASIDPASAAYFAAALIPSREPRK